jgi:RNase P protein component
MKRRLREAVRLTLPLDALAVDIVINPKKPILAADFTDVVREVERAFAVIAQKLGTGSASDLKGRVSRLTHTRAGVPAPHESVPRKS